MGAEGAAAVEAEAAAAAAAAKAKARVAMLNTAIADERASDCRLRANAANVAARVAAAEAAAFEESQTEPGGYLDIEDDEGLYADVDEPDEGTQMAPPLAAA